MLSLLLSLALADVIEVTSPPSEVTVYADRARVTRTGVSQLPRGTHEVTFVGLPATTDPESLTADVSGSAELLDIQVRMVSAVEAADERVAGLLTHIQDLLDTRQDLLDDQQAASAKLSSIGAARGASATQLSAQLLVGTNGPSRADALQRELSREDTEARSAVRQATLAIRDLDVEIAAARREQASLGSNATDTLTAVVRVDVSSGGRIGVDLTYMVGGAYWQPRYDLRSDGGSDSVSLSLSAIVTQRTGEDWSNVDLSVSSARPGRGTDVPRLDPFWLMAYRPRPTSRSTRGGGAPMAAMAESMDASVGAAAPAPPPPMEVAQAVVETQLAATTFSVENPESMPSDGTARKVLLTTVELESELRHVSVPRIDPTAFLIGEVTNTASFPLLPGPAGVFVAGAYVGDITLNTVPTGETFDVSFGPDDRVVVTRTRLATNTGGDGPVGRRRNAEWEWGIDIRSTHQSPVNVEIREQVPTSRTEDVVVTYKVESGSPEVSEEDGGILAFTVDVPARRSAGFEWTYTVTYPGDRTLGWME
jgi:uncharacterized protein (TIGR02231 family)